MRFTAIIVTSIFCLTIAHGTPDADQASPGQPANTVVVTPSVYLSDTPNLCFPVDSAQPLYLYLHAPDNPGLTSVSFDLQLQGATVDPLVFLPVGIVDLTTTQLGPGAYHFDVTPGSGPFDHLPIIQPYYLSDPLLQGDQMVTDVVYNGDTSGRGIWTFAGCCVDCLTCNHAIDGPNSMDVPIASTSTYEFDIWWNCFASGGGAISVTDSEGWVTSWAPQGQAGPANCGLCFWPIDEGTVTIEVPYNVTNGTTSQMVIQGINAAKTVTLQAIQSVPTEAATWGAIKALYE